jgi:hypothetical protein
MVVSFARGFVDDFLRDFKLLKGMQIRRIPCDVKLGLFRWDAVEG